MKMLKIDVSESKKLYNTNEIEIKSGVNILVGRNGVGKYTLLRLIKSHCNKNNIPCLNYDNYTQGGNSASEKYMFYGQMESFMNVAFHSEGEQLFYNFGEQLKQIGQFIAKHKDSKEIVILLDALDSGLDVEGLSQVKEVFYLILKDNEDKDVYIVASANNYSLIKNMRCIDVKKQGKERLFKTYDEFEKFIFNQYIEERK